MTTHRIFDVNGLRLQYLKGEVRVDPIVDESSTKCLSQPLKKTIHPEGLCNIRWPLAIWHVGNNVSQMPPSFKILHGLYLGFGMVVSPNALYLGLGLVPMFWSIHEWNENFTYICYSFKIDKTLTPRQVIETVTIIDLIVNSLIERWNCGFDPSLRKLSVVELTSSFCCEVYFESWVQLLGPPLPTSHPLREFEDLKKGIYMGLVVLTAGSAYTRLAWPTHCNRTS